MSGAQFDVAIAGAGLAGRTLAILLARTGIRCVLIDTTPVLSASPSNRVDPRALAITPATRAILSSINIWQRVSSDHIGRFERMQVWDDSSGGQIQFDSADICAPELGCIVEQSVLQSLLEQACAGLPDCTSLNDRISDMENCNDGVTVKLANGGVIRARLLVGADGSHSPVRQLAGLEYHRQDYQQRALACIVRTTLGHDNVARQRFMPGGPLAFLPLADPHQSGIVWSTTPELAQQLLELPALEFRARLQEAFEYRLGEVMESSMPIGFDLFDARAPAYVTGSVVLAGDAAHTVHPLAGQGANLGLMDVAVLAELMQQARQTGRDPCSRRVLRNYERWRKADNLRMRFVLNSLKLLFESELSLLVRLRGSGMNAFDSIPALKSAIMRQAMGLEGDLPRMARQPVDPEMN